MMMVMMEMDERGDERLRMDEWMETMLSAFANTPLSCICEWMAVGRNSLEAEAARREASTASSFDARRWQSFAPLRTPFLADHSCL